MPATPASGISSTLPGRNWTKTEAVPRGDVVVATGVGYAGKPRPCIVLQADAFAATDSVTVVLLTSETAGAPDLRIAIAPAAGNGLAQPSWAMVDKVMTLRRDRIARTIGRLTDDEMTAISRAIIVFLGLA
jgi:mRNA interferase MazF